MDRANNMKRISGGESFGDSTWARISQSLDKIDEQKSAAIKRKKAYLSAACLMFMVVLTVPGIIKDKAVLPVLVATPTTNTLTDTPKSELVNNAVITEPVRKSSSVLSAKKQPAVIMLDKQKDKGPIQKDSVPLPEVKQPVRETWIVPEYIAEVPKATRPLSRRKEYINTPIEKYKLELRFRKDLMQPDQYETAELPPDGMRFNNN